MKKEVSPGIYCSFVVGAVKESIEETISHEDSPAASVLSVTDTVLEGKQKIVRETGLHIVWISRVALCYIYRQSSRKHEVGMEEVRGGGAVCFENAKTREVSAKERKT